MIYEWEPAPFSLLYRKDSAFKTSQIFGTVYIKNQARRFIVEKYIESFLDKHMGTISKHIINGGKAG